MHGNGNWVQKRGLLGELNYEAEEQVISVDSHAEVIGKIGDLVRGQLTASIKDSTIISFGTKQVVCKEIVEHEIRECLSELARVIIDDEHFDSKESPEETGSSFCHHRNKRKRGQPRTGTVN